MSGAAFEIRSRFDEPLAFCDRLNQARWRLLNIEADDGTMEFQSYALTRDFSSWLFSIGAMVRDNRTGISDYGILFGFTLKDLPQFNFDFDFNPGIGGQGQQTPGGN